MFHTLRHRSVSHGQPRDLSSRALRLLCASCWRIGMIVLLSTLSVLASWALIVPASALAASRAAQTSTAAPAATPASTASTQTTPAAAQPPSGTGRFKALAQQSRILAPHTANVSSSHPYNGLGDLPFYTYVYQKTLSDQLQMKVNVANGNLLLHATPEQIHGTGLD